MTSTPVVMVIGGPNGAGKTTVSRAVLAQSARIVEFVNADVLALGLSGFDPERTAFQAGRLMLARLQDLAHSRSTFAFESTLASRTFAPWLRGLIDSGYDFHLVYCWVESPQLALRRVRARVRAGGHSVPAEVVRRRYQRSISNFLHLYRPIARSWRMYNNTGSVPTVVADGGLGISDRVYDASAWKRLSRLADGQAEIE